MFLDWPHSVANFFQWYNLDDKKKVIFFQDMKVIFIAAKFKEIARSLWERYQRSGYSHVARWEDIRATLVRRFKPTDYEQCVSLSLCKEASSLQIYT